MPRRGAHARRWTIEESVIDPKDPIFDIALGRRKAQDWGKGTERTSVDHDRVLYGDLRSS